MMQRMFNFLSSRISGLHQAAYILGSFAFLSSLLAFVRDRLLAHTFGAGISLDVYYAAFRIPDLIFVMVASLVSAYVLIPVITGRDDAGQRDYVDSISLVFFTIIVLVSGGAFLIAPRALESLFPTLISAGYGSVLVSMTRIMLLQPILLGFSNIFAAIVQVRGRYMLYATTPLVYNLGIIFGVIVFYPLWGLTGLAWGVVLGALFHLGIQMPAVMADGFFNRFPSSYNLSVFWDTASVSLPRALALATNQISMFALVAIAGGLSAGSIAVFTFAFNLQAVPLAIIGASYSVAAFPLLANMFSNGEREQFVGQVVVAARHILFWSLPTVALAIVLRAHVVRVILGTGAFDWTDTRLTAASFALFILSLAAHALVLLLVRGYYAAGRTLTPLAISAGVLGLTISLAYALLGVFGASGVRLFIEALLRVEDVPGAEVLMLPFAYSIASIIGAVVLVIFFEKAFGGLVRGIARAFGESFTAAGVAGFVAYGTLLILGGLTSATTLSLVLLHGFISGATGICAAVCVFWILGSQEFKETVRVLHRRWRTQTVFSGESEL